MAKIGSYGWTPKQMERINARRMERGREPLINLRNIETEEDYKAAQNLIARSNEKRKPVVMQDEEEKSLKQRASERAEAFKSKFKPSDSFKSSEERTADFRKKFQEKLSSGSLGKKPRTAIGKNKGISTPATQDAMDRIMGAA